MKNVAVILVNFNQEDLTHQCLDSLAKLRTHDFKFTVIVVDNGSEVPFKLNKQEKARKNISVILNKDNLGFTGGNNTAMKLAIKSGFDYVCLLNNDTMVDPNLVSQLLKVAESDIKVGIVVPKIYFARGHEFHKDRYKKNDLGKVFWYGGGFIDWASIFTTHRGVDEVDYGQYDKVEQTGFASGCCMLIPVEVLRHVGLFDDKYFLYFEDGDLSERVKRAGFKIVYNPQAKLWHINAGSTGGSGSVLQDYFITRNRMLFGMKYSPVHSKISLIRESLRLLLNGRQWQKIGIRDFYLGRFGKGSFFK